MKIKLTMIKPPIGIIPPSVLEIDKYLNHFDRIKELSAAILRQFENPDYTPNIDQMLEWNTEITDRLLWLQENK